jgi:hypothetical protein
VQVSLKEAQTLAHHATPQLTMNVYAEKGSESEVSPEIVYEYQQVSAILSSQGTCMACDDLPIGEETGKEVSPCMPHT